MLVAAGLIQLAVTTVPEPNTLALLAAGVTAVGVCGGGVHGWPVKFTEVPSLSRQGVPACCR
jgi:hypothetical protein